MPAGWGSWPTWSKTYNLRFFIPEASCNRRELFARRGRLLDRLQLPRERSIANIVGKKDSL